MKLTNTTKQLGKTVLLTGLLAMTAGGLTDGANAAPQSSVPPSALRPLPDLKVRILGGGCKKIPHVSGWVLTANISVQNATGTPTSSSFVTQVGAKGTKKNHIGNTTAYSTTFGDHTIASGFNSSEFFVLTQKPVSGSVKVFKLWATVDKNKQVHEKNGANNSYELSTNIVCAR